MKTVNDITWVAPSADFDQLRALQWRILRSMLTHHAPILADMAIATMPLQSDDLAKPNWQADGF